MSATFLTYLIASIVIPACAAGIPIFILKADARQKRRDDARAARAQELVEAERRGAQESHSDADLRGDQQKFIRNLLQRVATLEKEVDRLRGELATERQDRQAAQAAQESTETAADLP